MSAYSGQVPETLRAPDWRAKAACRAKDICARCPVWRECLAHALRTRDNEHGIRGGLKPGERRDLARQMARRAGQPVPDEEPPPLPERTLQSLWDGRTKADGDHLLWDAGTPVYFEGRTLTPQKIGFRLGRGREPVGVVRKTCDRDGCVLPAHLGDQRDRDRKRMAARRAADRLAAQAAEREAVAS